MLKKVFQSSIFQLTSTSCYLTLIPILYFSLTQQNIRLNMNIAASIIALCRFHQCTLQLTDSKESWRKCDSTYFSFQFSYFHETPRLQIGKSDNAKLAVLKYILNKPIHDSRMTHHCNGCLLLIPKEQIQVAHLLVKIILGLAKSQLLDVLLFQMLLLQVLKLHRCCHCWCCYGMCCHRKCCFLCDSFCRCC